MSLLAHESDDGDDELPAWSLPASAGDSIRIRGRWPERVTRDWAWGESTGAGGGGCVSPATRGSAANANDASSSGLMVRSMLRFRLEFPEPPRILHFGG